MAHKSAKKQGHVSVPIQEHLQQCAGADPAAEFPMCAMHPDQMCSIFCNTCSQLICAMCAAFNHAGHDYKPAAEVSGEHRDAIGAQVAVTVVSRDEVVAAKTGWEGACVQLRRNGEAAIEKLNLEFRRMAQQGTKRRDVLIAQVKAVVLFKLGLLEAQVKGGSFHGRNQVGGSNDGNSNAGPSAAVQNVADGRAPPTAKPRACAQAMLRSVGGRDARRCV
jgi:hypothetical protein